MAEEIFVIVTARNEAESIASTLAALRASMGQARLIVADDASTDATAEIAADAGARVISGARALGKGAAATLAAREALLEASIRSGSPVFVLCDGDLGACAGELDALAQTVARGDADMAVAAFTNRVGGGFGLTVAVARLAIRRRCGLRTRAPICGQRALRAQALRDVLPFAHGFGMEVGMTIDAVRASHRVVEVELDLSHRAHGRTPAGFAHRARQLADIVRVYAARGRPTRTRA